MSTPVPMPAGGAPVLVMAGGTGGHVFPALAVAAELRARGVPVVWLGARSGLEAKLVPAHGFAVEWLEVAGLRGKGWARRLAAPLMLARALWQAARVLRRLRPRLVLGFGGYVSGPAGLMARLLGVPLLIHEQNAIAGYTNRILARLATRVCEAFPGAFPAALGAVTTGNPVRAAIAQLPSPVVRGATHGGRPRLLVLGGSQGALALNRLVPQALALLPAANRPEVVHQAGGRMLDEAAAAYREAGVEARLEPFIDDMAAAYAAADLVVCRAGALTVAELAAAGVASLLVPFPFAVDDHQSANGRFLERAGAARVLVQATLTPESLAAELAALLPDRERLLAMALAARALARPDAARTVAELGLALAHPAPAPTNPADPANPTNSAQDPRT